MVVSIPKGKRLELNAELLTAVPGLPGAYPGNAAFHGTLVHWRLAGNSASAVRWENVAGLILPRQGSFNAAQVGISQENPEGTIYLRNVSGETGAVDVTVSVIGASGKVQTAEAQTVNLIPEQPEQPKPDEDLLKGVRIRFGGISS